jgi:hypothetical protein
MEAASGEGCGSRHDGETGQITVIHGQWGCLA